MTEAERKAAQRARLALGQVHKRVWVKAEDEPEVDDMAANADRAVKKHDEGEK